MNKVEFKELIKSFQDFSIFSQKGKNSVSTLKAKQTFSFDKYLATFSAFDQYFYLIADATDLKFVKAGGSLKAMIGYEPTDFEGKSYYKMLKIHSLKDVIKSAIGGSKYFKYLYSQPPENRMFIKANRTLDIICKDGKIIHCLAQSIPIVFNENMEVIYFLNIVTDLSNIKHEKTFSHFIVDASDDQNIKTIPTTFYKKTHANSNAILSKAEISVLNFMANGYSSKEIADKLYISEHTVKNHRKNMLKKYDCHSSAELVKKALADGLI